MSIWCSVCAVFSTLAIMRLQCVHLHLLFPLRLVCSCAECCPSAGPPRANPRNPVGSLLKSNQTYPRMLSSMTTQHTHNSTQHTHNSTQKHTTAHNAFLTAPNTIPHSQLQLTSIVWRKEKETQSFLFRFFILQK